MRIYFMGACGTAMGNAAIMLKAHGEDVMGADSGAYPPMSEALRRENITVFEGYDAHRLARLKPDLVVVGNGISRGNPEVEWLLQTERVAYTSLPQLLSERILAGRKNIVITGTHGKTTTAALSARLLLENGVEAGYFIGGVPLDLPFGANHGDAAAPFVIEGDEYDCALFDKRSKFIHYRPHIVVINNLEFDHCDIFRDLTDLKRAFNHLIRIIPKNGYLLVNGDDRNIDTLLPVPWTTLLRVGTEAHNDLRIRYFSESQKGASFALQWKGIPWTEISWSLGGRFNARNAAMAALACGLSLNPDDPLQLKLDSLARAKGVKRRQETLFETPGLKVIEDFGHHPTAIEETLRSMRRRYPGSRLIVCFEPRSNTARRSIFQSEFGRALKQGDSILIGPVNRAGMLAPEERLDTERLARELAGPKREAEAFESNRALLNRLLHKVDGKPDGNDILTFFTNGSFDGIIGRFVSHLQRKME